RAGHQRIFEAMLKLADRGEAIDVVTVTSALQDSKHLEEAGGVSYLTEVAGSVPTAANINYYSKIVEEKALLRRLIRTATEIVTDTFTRVDAVEDVINEAEKGILEVSGRKNRGSYKANKDDINEVTYKIEQIH